MRTPLESFDRFLQLTPDLQTVYSVKRDEFLDLLDSFLANPGQHREHVRLISEAAAAVWVLELMPYFNVTRWPLGLGRLFSRRMRWSQDYLDKIARLKEELRSTAQPGQFDVDILPSRLVETPPEWKNYQLHLVEVRVAVHPSHNLVPDKVSVSLAADSTAPIRFIDCLPSTEFADQGEHEVSVTSEGMFVRSGSLEATAKVGVSTPTIGVGLAGAGSLKAEAASTEASSYRFKFQSVSPKTISSAVAGQARWELLRTPNQIPVGGLKLAATVLAPASLDSCSLTARLEVDLAGWGIVSLTLSRAAPLSKQTAVQQSVAADASASQSRG